MIEQLNEYPTPTATVPVAGQLTPSVAGAIVKLCDPLVPADVVTVTLTAPGLAFPAMANVAVISVALTTCTLLTVIPALAAFTVAPEIKFVPVSVTATLLPGDPLFGLIDVSVGAPVTVPLTVAVAVCAVGVVLSVTLIVALNAPAAVGVPLITTVLPDTLIPTPAGNAPALIAAL